MAGRCATTEEAHGGSTVVRLGADLRVSTARGGGQERDSHRVLYQGVEEKNWSGFGRIKS